MDKVVRIRELVRTIEDAEAELRELTGSEPAPTGKKRGRPRKENGDDQLPLSNTVQLNNGM